MITTTLLNGTSVDAHQYYLLSGSKILCDTTKVRVVQSHGDPTTVSDGYEITDTGYTFIIPNNTTIGEMIYSIM